MATAAAAPIAVPGLRRNMVTICAMTATIMQALDTTIANVALPYMQGSVSASQDQINWVLTSYIVAAAIMTPQTGYLAERFGLKRLFLVSVAGFTVASMLCGMAQSLVEIVLFRVLQGLFGTTRAKNAAVQVGWICPALSERARRRLQQFLPPAPPHLPIDPSDLQSGGGSAMASGRRSRVRSNRALSPSPPNARYRDNALRPLHGRSPPGHRELEERGG